MLATSSPRSSSDRKPLKKQKTDSTLLYLLLFAFCSAFFPRLLLLVKLPSLVSLYYLVIVPVIAIFILVKTRVRDRLQITIAKELLFALGIFFGVNIASAILNEAGFINAFLNFLFFTIHFLFLIALISLSLTKEQLQQLRNFIIFASFTNLLLALFQGVTIRSGNPDDVKGVFIGGGAGHVLGTSVSLTFGIFYLVTAKNVPLWFRGVVALATLVHMNMADAKQVMLFFMVAGVLFLLLKLKDISKVITYLIPTALFFYVFYWATQNIPALNAFNTWMRPEIYGPDGEATLLKTATFRIVPTFYHSPLNHLLGLGPGHTVGRLGGWMLDNYASLLTPLGSTTHPASAAVWKASSASYLGNQSSMFSPLFGWAGIWGDLGWLGLISFACIWFVVWHRLCVSDASKFLVLTPLVSGFIFTQMEEPGYMIYVAMIVGFWWHDHRLKIKESYQMTELSSFEDHRR
jgi:hypothetical protein